MSARCRDCPHCKAFKRTSTTRAARRNLYYCVHQRLKEIPVSAFGRSAVGFIGYGDNADGGMLTLKTHPRWCPIERLGE